MLRRGFPHERARTIGLLLALVACLALMTGCASKAGNCGDVGFGLQPERCEEDITAEDTAPVHDEFDGRDWSTGAEAQAQPPPTGTASDEATIDAEEVEGDGSPTPEASSEELDTIVALEVVWLGLTAQERTRQCALFAQDPATMSAFIAQQADAPPAEIAGWLRYRCS